MSADNGVYILRSMHCDKSGVEYLTIFEYRVAYAIAIDNIFFYDNEGDDIALWHYFSESDVFSNEDDAYKKAHEIIKEYNHVEYGISTIIINKKFPLEEPKCPDHKADMKIYPGPTCSRCGDDIEMNTIEMNEFNKKRDNAKPSKAFIKQYIRNRKNRRVGVFIAIPIDNEYFGVGYSLCNIKKDEFDYNIATLIATGRAHSIEVNKYDEVEKLLSVKTTNSYRKLHPKFRKIGIPESIKDKMIEFIKRCENEFENFEVHPSTFYEGRKYFFSKKDFSAV